MSTRVKCFQIIVLILIVGCSSKDKLPENHKLMFDHTFKVIEDEEDFFSLEGRGFTLDKKPVRHPGPVDCRFVKFTPDSYPFFQYLEWCYTPSFAKMKLKMAEKQEGVQTWNGIGFRTYGNVTKIFSKLKSSFEDNGIYSFHKNFDWETNSKDILPGWDYIGFKKPLISDISIFGIKYGKPKKKKVTKSSHSNSAFKIIGSVIDLNDKNLEEIARFSSAEVNSGIVTNERGFHIIQFRHFKDRVKYFKNKRTNYKAVILKISNKALFKKYAKPDYHFTLYGQHFYGIKTKHDSWDILATLNDDFISEIRKESMM